MLPFRALLQHLVTLYLPPAYHQGLSHPLYSLMAAYVVCDNILQFCMLHQQLSALQTLLLLHPPSCTPGKAFSLLLQESHFKTSALKGTVYTIPAPI